MPIGKNKNLDQKLNKFNPKNPNFTEIISELKDIYKNEFQTDLKEEEEDVSILESLKEVLEYLSENDTIDSEHKKALDDLCKNDKEWMELLGGDAVKASMDLNDVSEDKNGEMLHTLKSTFSEYLKKVTPAIANEKKDVMKVKRLKEKGVPWVNKLANLVRHIDDSKPLTADDCNNIVDLTKGTHFGTKATIRKYFEKLKKKLKKEPKQ